MNIDVFGIFERLYGYRPEPFQIDDKVTKSITKMGSAIYGGSDVLGREVFCPVTISSGSKDYELPYSLVSLRRRKIMIETDMVERGGSVKEIIGLRDWQISIKGFVFDSLNQFPDEQLYELGELFAINEPVNLKCALTDLFLLESDKIVLTDFSLPDKQAVESVRDFQFEAMSDNIFTLTIK